MKKNLESAESLLAEITGRAGKDVARLSTVEDSIDGQQPRIVLEPASVETVSIILAWASARALTVCVRGGGTKLAWGDVLSSVDVLLSTTRLNKSVDHRHGDLTATVETGVTLAKLNAALGLHDQWLPLDSPWADRATVGGIVSTNDSGPSRHYHGAPRDLIIGCSIVLSNGQIAKSGGIVVKNVAGYDLGRLLTGSFGSLAVMTSATFKLAPRATHSCTVSVALPSWDVIPSVVSRLTLSPLTPTAFELEWPPGVLYVTFKSVKSSAQQQADIAEQLISDLALVNKVEGIEETQLWEKHTRQWDKPGSLVKLSTVPSALFDSLSWLRSICKAHDVEIFIGGRVALGVVDIRLCGSVESQALVINQFRKRVQNGDGSAVLRRAETALRNKVDPWGNIEALSVMKLVKDQFDPDKRLNPGRGPGGI